MTHISKILLLPAALVCFAACSSDDGFAPAKGGGSGSPVVVRAAVGESGIYTRTNPASSDTTEQKRFDQGDKIHVIDKANGFESDYTLDANGVWQPADAARFLTWQSKKDNHFQAFYPADGRNSFVRWHVEKDQSTLEGLKASDVMTFENLSVDEPANHILDVAFKRWTARVVVEIASYRDQYTPEANPVTALTVKGCDIDNSSDEQIADVQAYKIPGEGTQRFVALVLGSRGEQPDDTFLTLKVANGNGEDELNVKGLPFLEAGKSYNLRLVIGKDKAEVQSVTVNPWKDGIIDIAGGEAERSLTPLGSLVSAKDLGKVVGSDGYIYPNRAAAEAAGATPTAMIAYVGSETGDPNYTHGLAFGLPNTTDYCDWTVADLERGVESYKAANPVPNACSGWKLPSIDNLKRMFAAFGGDPYVQGMPEERSTYNFGNFYNKLIECGVSMPDGKYFSGPLIYTSDELFWDNGSHKGYWSVVLPNPTRRYATTDAQWINNQDAIPRCIFAF